MTDLEDINPVYIDDEPVCSGEKFCPRCMRDCKVEFNPDNHNGLRSVPIREGEVCIPGLRRDRDKLLRGLQEILRLCEENKR